MLLVVSVVFRVSISVTVVLVVASAGMAGSTVAFVSAGLVGSTVVFATGGMTGANVTLAVLSDGSLGEAVATVSVLALAVGASVVRVGAVVPVVVFVVSFASVEGLVVGAVVERAPVVSSAGGVFIVPLLGSEPRTVTPMVGDRVVTFTAELAAVVGAIVVAVGAGVAGRVVLATKLGAPVSSGAPVEPGNRVGEDVVGSREGELDGTREGEVETEGEVDTVGASDGASESTHSSSLDGRLDLLLIILLLLLLLQELFLLLPLPLPLPLLPLLFDLELPLLLLLLLLLLRTRVASSTSSR